MSLIRSYLRANACEGWVETVSAYLEYSGNLRKLGPNAGNYGLGYKQSIF